MLVNRGWQYLRILCLWTQKKCPLSIHVPTGVHKTRKILEQICKHFVGTNKTVCYTCMQVSLLSAVSRMEFHSIIMSTLKLCTVYWISGILAQTWLTIYCQTNKSVNTNLVIVVFSSLLCLSEDKRSCGKTLVNRYVHSTGYCYVQSLESASFLILCSVNRAFLLTWQATMQIYGKKRNSLCKKTV